MRNLQEDRKKLWWWSGRCRSAAFRLYAIWFWWLLLLTWWKFLCSDSLSENRSLPGLIIKGRVPHCVTNQFFFREKNLITFRDGSPSSFNLFFPDFFYKKSTFPETLKNHVFVEFLTHQVPLPPLRTKKYFSGVSKEWNVQIPNVNSTQNTR